MSSATTARARIPASDHVLGADRGVRAGVLCVLVDLAGGAAAVRTLHPDWMATADLAVQLGAPARGPWVEARASVIRRGRTTLVVEAGIFDVDGPGTDPEADTTGDQVGVGTLTMAVLPARPGAVSLVPEEESFPSQWAFDGRELSRPVEDALSVHVLDQASGHLSMPVVPYVHNSFGAAQGGVMGLLGELSGLAAVDSAAGGRGGAAAASAAVTDLQVAYVALGRVGPISSRAEVLATSAGGGGRAIVELTDEGAGGRVTTVVNVVAAVPRARGAAA